MDQNLLLVYDLIMQVLSMFSGSHALEWLLFMLITGILYILIRLHLSSNSNLNLEHLITTNGKIDEKKFTRFGAWFLSSWGFLYLLIQHPDSIPEWYFLGYMGIWVSNVILEKYVGNKTPSKDE